MRKGRNDVVFQSKARLESIGDCAEIAEQRVIDVVKRKRVGEIERAGREGENTER